MASPMASGANATQMAAQRCSAAVQSRLSQRGGLNGILGAVLGAQSYGGRVLQVTQVNPRRSTVRVRGLASSGANYGYGPYGVGAYGAAGYGYAPDLSFRSRGRLPRLHPGRRHQPPPRTRRR